jgi:hypothetical protein
MSRFSSSWAALGGLALCLAATAEAHGIAGNRYFPGTLTFDDPAVADEAVLPQLGTSSDGATEDRLDWSFTRLLVPGLAFEAEGGALQDRWPGARATGFDTTSIGLKAEIYRDDQHETLVSAGLLWGIGGSGSKRVGADAPDSLQPGIFFGRGFGDLPDNVAWLRPFGLAGSITGELPTHGSAANFDYSAQTRTLVPVETSQVPVLHWGLALEYSTLYLTDRFTPGELPEDEPLDQLVPLVEFAFDTPRGQRTTGTVNPGLSYVSDEIPVQIAAEFSLPVTGGGQHGVGGQVQLLVFLDDLLPSLFGKPVFGK